MSSIKDTIKYFLGYIRCIINRIKPNHHVYIGKGVNIVIAEGTIKFGRDVVINPNVDLWATGGMISIDDGIVIGERCRVSIAHSLTIGKNVLFSPNVYVTDCDHEYHDISIPVIKQGIVKKDNHVSIDDGVYIGINSVIVGNVKIGKGSVIGANSVVTKNVPDFCVAVGIPARIIKKYNSQFEKWESI